MFCFGMSCKKLRTFLEKCLLSTIQRNSKKDPELLGLAVAQKPGYGVLEPMPATLAELECKTVHHETAHRDAGSDQCCHQDRVVAG